MKIRELKPIFALGFCAFLMILAEFAPISLLSNIAKTLKTEPNVIGLSVSIYAIAGATFGLLFSLIFNKFNRKVLFIVIFILLFIGNTAILYSDNIIEFFIFRFLCAVGHGIFWAVVVDFSIKLVEVENRSIASSIIFSSIPIATITGLPILNYIGNQLNWQLSFSLISLCCILCLLLIIFFIPNINTEIENEPIVLKNLLKNKFAWSLIAVTAMVSTAHFCSYTYIEPYVRQLSFFSNSHLLMVFLIFGVSGIFGNIITMKFMNKYIAKMTFIFLFLMISSLFLIYYIGNEISFYGYLLLIFLWGVSISILFTSLQTWVVVVSNKSSAIMAAFNSAILNYSIGLGSILGAGIISKFDIIWLFFCSSIFLLIALIQLFNSLKNNKKYRNKLS
ncbi:MAG: MFS transporter [Acinetobacter sp.]